MLGQETVKIRKLAFYVENRVIKNVQRITPRSAAISVYITKVLKAGIALHV